MSAGPGGIAPDPPCTADASKPSERAGYYRLNHCTCPPFIPTTREARFALRSDRPHPAIVSDAGGLRYIQKMVSLLAREVKLGTRFPER